MANIPEYQRKIRKAQANYIHDDLIKRKPYREKRASVLLAVLHMLDFPVERPELYESEPYLNTYTTPDDMYKLEVNAGYRDYQWELTVTSLLLSDDLDYSRCKTFDEDNSQDLTDTLCWWVAETFTTLEKKNTEVFGIE